MIPNRGNDLRGISKDNYVISGSKEMLFRNPEQGSEEAIQNGFEDRLVSRSEKRHRMENEESDMSSPRSWEGALFPIEAR